MARAWLPDPGPLFPEVWPRPCQPVVIMDFPFRGDGGGQSPALLLEECVQQTVGGSRTSLRTGCGAGGCTCVRRVAVTSNALTTGPWEDLLQTLERKHRVQAVCPGALPHRHRSLTHLVTKIFGPLRAGSLPWNMPGV